MIQNKDNFYINKTQILYIKEESNAFDITMIDGKHYYVYASVDFNYYMNVYRLLNEVK